MRGGFAALALGFAGLTPGFAAEPLYQALADADCKVVLSDEAGATSLCSGPYGTPFLLADVDARVSVTFGGVDADSNPRTRSFSQFNSVGETIEWRVESGRAVAAILRWSVQPGDGADGSVLIVSRVGAENVPGCVAAYVDAQANPAPNELARQAAERIVPNIDCETHVPFFFGRRGPTAGDPTL